MFGRLQELVKPREEELQLNDCETAAAVILREAIEELMGLQEKSQGGEAAADSAPAADDHDALSATWTVDGPVQMGGVDGSGELSLVSGYVVWNPSSGASDDPWQQLPLSDIID